MSPSPNKMREITPPTPRDLWMSKRLGLKAECPNCDGQGYTRDIDPSRYGIAPKVLCYNCMSRGEVPYTVNLTDFAADRELACDWLGERALLSICSSGISEWFIWDEGNQCHQGDDFSSSKEALFAAIDYLMETTSYE